ncbi:thioredoxin [Gammaproteobacteria bacterium]|nr:thioredoxin [Gammaproteobacteria bacterium]
MSKILVINNENFKSFVLESEKPVVIDFWAPWCAPCRQVMPIFEECANNNHDVVFGKVNVDENREIAAEYGIRGIPTMLLFNQGELVATHVGAVSKTELETFINDID